MPEALLAIDNVAVEYAVPPRWGKRAAPLRAVDGVSLEVQAGETVALVGESGCGKTTLARALLGLVPLASGQVRFEGQLISGRTAPQLKPVRRRMQLVFQASETALDPRRTVGQSVAEGLVIHGVGTAATQHAKVLELLGRVGLPEDVAERRPEALSGGQRQRVGIARALALDPVLLIADEPTSALDTSVQLQILDLFLELQRALHLTMLFISHDLASVRYLGARTAVMRRGRLVEETA